MYDSTLLGPAKAKMVNRTKLTSTIDIKGDYSTAKNSRILKPHVKISNKLDKMKTRFG